jgi:hypothetical protein
MLQHLTAGSAPAAMTPPDTPVVNPTTPQA